MHHYGEDSTIATVSGNTFEIKSTNKETGATVTLSGPVKGVLESGNVVDYNFATDLAREFAHFLRDNMTGLVLNA